MPTQGKGKTPQLSAKQKLFCQRWLIHRNASRAYREAYETNDDNVCAVEGHRNLRKPNIRRFLDIKLEEIEDRFDMDLDKCLKGMFRIASANMLDYINLDGTVNLSELTHDQAAAIQEVTVETYEERTGRGDETETVKKVKLKLYDKKGALKDLGQHFGGFKTKVEHSVTEDLADAIKKARERSGK